MEGGKALIGRRERQRRSVGSQGNPECQEGNPLGASYLGSMNVTTSGRTCQAWSAQEPHKHDPQKADDPYPPFVGDQNYCRVNNPSKGGVRCLTTDPDERWEFCDVPICDATYTCQEGEPLGATYVGSVNVTASGKACMGWHTVSSSYWYLKLGEHNYCRNPGQPSGRSTRSCTHCTLRRWRRSR